MPLKKIWKSIDGGILGTNTTERYFESGVEIVEMPDSSREPFSLYSMRQAIEEGFILDVLKNFITYRTYWKLLKKVKEDPRYDRQKASKLLTRFVAENPKTIREKSEVVVEHLSAKVLDQIGHRGRAMLVTGSRQQGAGYRRHARRGDPLLRRGR